MINHLVSNMYILLCVTEQLSLSHSNFSMAFPYVAFLEEKGKLDNSLFSEFIENCGHKLEMNHVAYLESCSIDGENFKKLQDLQSFQVIKL